MFQNNYTVIFFTVTPYFYRYDIWNVFSDASRFGCIVLDYKLDFTRIFGIGICIGKLTVVRDLTRLDYVSELLIFSEAYQSMLYPRKILIHASVAITELAWN